MGWVLMLLGKKEGEVVFIDMQLRVRLNPLFGTFWGSKTFYELANAS